MKELMKEIAGCEDVVVLKNVIAIMSDTCATSVSGPSKLDMMKKIKSEIGECCFSNEMARLHLGLIGKAHTIDDADKYLDQCQDFEINTFDWYVLWGEMVKRNEKKIKKWFPHINKEKFCEKICDECLTAIDGGLIPFHDFHV